VSDMHSYLKSIGFSNIKNRKDVDLIIKLIMEKATFNKKYTIDNNIAIAELSLEVADNIGITIYGEFDSDNKFHLDHYFPYFKSNIISMKEELFFNKKVDTDSYTIMCDDYRLGVSLIFYLQNTIDYIEKKGMLKPPYVYPIILSALSLEGKILMPVEKTENQIRSSIAEVKHRNQLLTEARNGNQEAIDSLTIDDMDLYSTVTKRIQKEDIYSIVETSFYPYGSESDNYTILGIIKDFKQVLNMETKEELYTILISCNQMQFEVCINKNDLLGEPQLGRRFKGNVWLQGYVEF